MFGLHALHPQTLREAASVVSGMRVADVGCGAHGGLVYHLARTVGTDGRVYAVDVQPHVLNIVERGNVFGSAAAPIETIWSDIEHYGGTAIPHGSLDRIFLINVVSELRDVLAALRECDRLLADAGTILVVDWGNEEHPLAPAALVPPEVIANAAAELGTLRLSALKPFGDHHYGMVFTR